LDTSGEQQAQSIGTVKDKLSRKKRDRLRRRVLTQAVNKQFLIPKV
jgi:hypothetical protein